MDGKYITLEDLYGKTPVSSDDKNNQLKPDKISIQPENKNQQDNHPPLQEKLNHGISSASDSENTRPESHKEYAFNQEERAKPNENEQSGEKRLPDPLSKPELPQVRQLPSGTRKFFKNTFVNLFIFASLFIVGVGLSMILRQALSSGSKETNNQEVTYATETPPPEQTITENINRFNTYYIKNSSLTNYSISYQLGEEILEPICEKDGCITSGTYLPGGSRFTASLRTASNAIKDFQNTNVTDALGNILKTTPSSILSKSALLFESSVSGVTRGGYNYTMINGVMIELDSNNTLELNHFAPAGIDSDFDNDKLIFERIVKSVSIQEKTLSPEVNRYNNQLESTDSAQF